MEMLVVARSGHCKCVRKKGSSWTWEKVTTASGLRQSRLFTLTRRWTGEERKIVIASQLRQSPLTNANRWTGEKITSASRLQQQDRKKTSAWTEEEQVVARKLRESPLANTTDRWTEAKQVVAGELPESPLTSTTDRWTGEKRMTASGRQQQDRKKTFAWTGEKQVVAGEVPESPLTNTTDRWTEAKQVVAGELSESPLTNTPDRWTGEKRVPASGLLRQKPLFLTSSINRWTGGEEKNLNGLGLPQAPLLTSSENRGRGEKLVISCGLRLMPLLSSTINTVYTGETILTTPGLRQSYHTSTKNRRPHAGGKMVTAASGRQQEEEKRKKTSPSSSASAPEKHFFQDALMREGGCLQYTKVSRRSGPDALFTECLDDLRHKRYDLDPDVDTQPSPAIERLNQNEQEVVYRVLQRVDPERKVSPRLETRGWYIDPFWDPFKRVGDLQQQVAHDLTEFARLVGAAEARRQRLILRAALRRHYRLHDPLHKRRYAWGSTRPEPFPTPHRTHDRFWDPTVDIRVALKNNNVPISWRDLHILHHFVGENGMILPRRTTHASRHQQRCIFKAISTARRMALFPYDWKPTAGELMPVMDPLQFLADELTTRYVASGDLRAEAMLRVMLAKYPELNYSRYLQAKALRNKGRREECPGRQEEPTDFSHVLRLYKQGGSTTTGRF